MASENIKKEVQKEPLNFDIFVSHQGIPLVVALQQSQYPFNLKIKDKKRKSNWQKSMKNRASFLST